MAKAAATKGRKPASVKPTGPSTTATEFLALPQVPPGRLFLLAGSDDYLREQVLERLRKALLDPGFAEFNHQVVRCAAGTKLQAVTDALAELPVMADSRLLELRSLEALNAKVAEAALPALHEAVKDPRLALVLTYEKATPLANAVAGQALTVTCQVEEKDRAAWARLEQKRLGLQLEEGALEALLERTGGELRQLAAHLEKLTLYAGGETLGKATIEELVPMSSQVQTWKLTAAIGQRNYPQAVELLDRLLGSGETAGTLLSYINRSLLSLVQVTALKQELGNPADVGAAMTPKKSDWQVKQTLKEAASWTTAELAATFDRLTRADMRIKTGEDPRLVLQLLLLQMCSRKGRG